jgi:hypothetical protein
MAIAMPSTKRRPRRGSPVVPQRHLLLPRNQARARCEPTGIPWLHGCHE